MVCFDHVDRFILSDVSFCVPKGQAVGLIGSSGAGKTTLLKLACGLLAPERGNVRILGREPVEAGQLIKRSVGVCIAGIPLLEGEDTVEEGFRLLRFPGRRILRAMGSFRAGLALGRSPEADARTCQRDSGRGCGWVRRFCQSPGCFCWTSLPAAWISAARLYSGSFWRSAVHRVRQRL